MQSTDLRGTAGTVNSSWERVITVQIEHKGPETME